jgi:glycosyltransferase involved in cell wall biosynthesis
MKPSNINTAVSVVVPVFNTARYLADALRSLRAQLFADFEVLVIDDGSTDNSVAIAMSFVVADSRFQVFSFEHGGLAAARNRGIELAKGQYIYFFDSDDLLTPDAIGALHEKLVESGADVIAFEASTFHDGGPIDISFSYRRHRCSERPVPAPIFLRDSLLSGCYFVSACCYAMRRDALGTARFPDAVAYEDNIFFLEIMTRKELTVAVLHKELFVRRIRPDSLMTSRRTLWHIDGYTKIIEYLLSNGPGWSFEGAGTAYRRCVDIYFRQWVKTVREATVGVPSVRRLGRYFPFAIRVATKAGMSKSRVRDLLVLILPTIAA